MNYFRLRNQSEGIKQFPQITEMSLDYNFDAYNSVSFLNKFYGKKLDFNPNFDHFVLDSHIELTDVLSFSRVYPETGFIATKKVIDILTNSDIKISETMTYPVRIRYKDDFLKDYFWIHLCETFRDKIDYSNSWFEKTDFLFQNKEKVRLSGYDNFLEVNKQIRQDKVGRLIFPHEITFLSPLENDMFSLGIGIYEWIISERLKQRLEVSGITGFEFIKVKWLAR